MKISLVLLCLLLLLSGMGCGKESTGDTEQISSVAGEKIEESPAEEDSVFPVASEKINGASAFPVIDTASLDLDGDGEKEECRITYGPTSGLYSVVITARDEKGDIKYENTFVLERGTITFGEKDGSPQVLLEGEYHKLYIKDDTIFIDGLED